MLKEKAFKILKHCHNILNKVARVIHIATICSVQMIIYQLYCCYMINDKCIIRKK